MVSWDERRDSKEEGEIMELMTSWEKKGIEKGIEQGIQKGIEQGIQKGIEQGIQKGIEQGIQKGIEQGIQKGIEQGLSDEKKATAKRMLQDGLDTDMIAKYTELSEEQVQAIKEEMEKQE